MNDSPENESNELALELENFEELEYEDYLKGHGQWARKPREKGMLVKELSATQ